jgi:hypothetical protein
MADAEEAGAEPRGGPEKPDEEEGEHSKRICCTLLFVSACMSFHQSEKN